MKLFSHETMSIKSLASKRGVTADNRAYLAPLCAAKIPRRETSDMLECYIKWPTFKKEKRSRK